MTKNQYISDCKAAPAAIGPYSQAVVTGNLVFLSGMIPLVPETGQIVGETVEMQTEQVLSNIAALLKHLGLSFANVVKTTIFLTDLSKFQVVNSLYEKALGENRPARSTIQVAGLPKAAKIEIEMIASKE